MKLLLDQGLARSAAGELVRRGHDAVHIGDIEMATATDEQILEHARREGQIVVTLDADFHALFALSNASGPSVVRVRIEGLRGSSERARRWSSQGDPRGPRRTLAHIERSGSHAPGVMRRRRILTGWLKRSTTASSEAEIFAGP